MALIVIEKIKAKYLVYKFAVTKHLMLFLRIATNIIPVKNE